jgi:hypothetical protein
LYPNHSNHAQSLLLLAHSPPVSRPSSAAPQLRAHPGGRSGSGGGGGNRPCGCGRLHKSKCVSKLGKQIWI